MSQPEATDRQRSYLLSLARQREVFNGCTPDEAVNRATALLDGDLTKTAASALIETWAQAPRYPRDAVPAEPWVLAALRATAADNAVFGLTHDRARTIERAEDTISAGLTSDAARTLLQQWRRAKPHPSERSPLPIALVDVAVEDVYEGHFAVFVDERLRFYRVYQPATGEYAQQTVIRRFASTVLLALYPDEARTVLRLIAEDRDAAAFRFADEHTRCWACGKVLTDTVSRLLSVGPSCRGFTGHQGLRAAAADVDANPERKATYRALHAWALAEGYTDPRDHDTRTARSTSGVMTASRMAAAWSGLPGMLTREPGAAVTLVEHALSGASSDEVDVMLRQAPADTLTILIGSGVLSSPVLTVLSEHRSPKVRAAAAEYLLRLLGG